MFRCPHYERVVANSACLPVIVKHFMTLWAAIPVLVAPARAAVEVSAPVTDTAMRPLAELCTIVTGHLDPFPSTNIKHFHRGNQGRSAPLQLPNHPLTIAETCEPETRITRSFGERESEQAEGMRHDVYLQSPVRLRYMEAAAGYNVQSGSTSPCLTE